MQAASGQEQGPTVKVEMNEALEASVEMRPCACVRYPALHTAGGQPTRPPVSSASSSGRAEQPPTQRHPEAQLHAAAPDALAAQRALQEGREGQRRDREPAGWSMHAAGLSATACRSPAPAWHGCCSPCTDSRHAEGRA